MIGGTLTYICNSLYIARRVGWSVAGYRDDDCPSGTVAIGRRMSLHLLDLSHLYLD